MTEENMTKKNVQFQFVWEEPKLGKSFREEIKNFEFRHFYTFACKSVKLLAVNVKVLCNDIPHYETFEKSSSVKY